MILSQLRDYMKEHQLRALKEIAEDLSIQQGAARHMLEHLINSKHIEKLPEGTACSGCSQCPPQSIELYRWL